MAALDRATTDASSTQRGAWLLAGLVLATACAGDDVIAGDGSGTSSTSAGSGATSTAHGVTSTSGPSGTSTASGTAADSGSTGDTPHAGGCFCGSFDELGPTCDAEALAAWAPTYCPEAQPCPRLTVECSRPGSDLYDCMTELVFDETAMQCMLETLRDRTPARLEVDGLQDYGVFSGQSLYLVYVIGPVPDASDLLAVRTGCLQGDVGAEAFGPTPHFLASPDYFTACMQVPDPRDRYDCMMNGLMDGTCEVAQAVAPDRRHSPGSGAGSGSGTLGSSPGS